MEQEQQRGTLGTRVNRRTQATDMSVQYYFRIPVYWKQVEAEANSREQWWLIVKQRAKQVSCKNRHDQRQHVPLRAQCGLD